MNIVITIAVALVGATVAVAAYRNGALTRLTPVLFALVTDAQKQYGQEKDMGKLKLSAVIGAAYAHLPPLVRQLVSVEKLTAMIELALQSAKIAWNSKPKLKEYVGL